jgi:hypothetical protein
VSTGVGTSSPTFISPLSGGFMHIVTLVCDRNVSPLKHLPMPRFTEYMYYEIFDCHYQLNATTQQRQLPPWRNWLARLTVIRIR